MPSFVKHILILAVAGLLGAGVYSTPLRSDAVPLQSDSASGTRIVIAAIGDIMMPGSLQNAVKRRTYNYDLLFEKIAPELSAADITFANLETPIDHTAAVSGYPKFNARPELLASLRKAGVKVVSVANNHVMDASVPGLKRTLDNIDAAGLLFIGAGRTKAESAKVVQTTVRGITIAWLAYTYSTNERLPKNAKEQPGVNILRPDSAADLAAAVDAVRKARLSADLVAVSLHWSDEYRSRPTPWQRRAAAELIEAGADIILGHHPHVLQPIESYAAKDGRQGLIAYSLGNFISSQNAGIANRNKTAVRALRGDGVILNIHAKKENGSTAITRAEFVPIWTLRERVGKIALSRPVNLSREIGRIKALEKRTKEEEDTLQLLGFRQKVIMDQLTVQAADEKMTK